MPYDPRTIAFLAEVLFPPVQLRPEVVQGIHNTLYRQREISYANFQVAQDGIHLTNVPDSPGAVSAATFLPDRLLVREELRATTLEDFATRLVNVAGLSLQALQVPVTIAQQFVVRSLVTPRNFTDSRLFLSERLLAAEPDAWHRLQRPIGGMGLRFTFPQDEEHHELFNLRIETWNQDPRSVWIENVGSFTQPVRAEDLPRLSNRLHKTYGFVTGPVCDLLGAFDRA